LPIREYSCEKCGNTFENIEIEMTTGNVVCPNCKSREVQQVFMRC
jgi:putative FmdB family regulatory protein